MSWKSENVSNSKRLDTISNTQTIDYESPDLRNSLIDLYLDVKIRSSDEIDEYDTVKFQKEKDKLEQLELITIVEYIKSSIEILMNMKLDESEQKNSTKYRPSSRPYFKRDDKPLFSSEAGKSAISDYEPPKEYEKVIQKLEGDIRNHIRVEQQLKLHIETVHNKMEEYEK